jgi:hypothetical protein
MTPPAPSAGGVVVNLNVGEGLAPSWAGGRGSSSLELMVGGGKHLTPGPSPISLPDPRRERGESRRSKKTDEVCIGSTAAADARRTSRGRGDALSLNQALDPWFCKHICQNGDASENDAASWDAVQTWLLNLRRQGFAVLIVHHDGKDGRQRGTSKREDIIDQVLHLKQPVDYKPSEGTRFEAHLTKGRQVWGDLAEAFEASVSGADSLAVWTWKALRAADRYKEIRELVLSGATVRSIAEEVSLPSTTVYRAIQKMRKQGELPEEVGRKKGWS